MNILMLLTRSPSGELSGRKMVLRTAINSLVNMGFSVDLVVFDKPDGSDIDIKGVGDVYYAGGVSFLSFLSAVMGFIFGNSSLSASIYYDKKRVGFLKLLESQKKYSLMYVDMIRLARFSEAIDIKCHLDLDDLLSLRYKDAGSVKGIFGYMTSKLPIPVSILEFFAGFILRRESQLVERDELTFASDKNRTVSLVSAVEAKKLANRVGRYIYSIPMSVSVTSNFRGASQGCGGVFLGGGGYKPNRSALDFYVNSVHECIKCYEKLAVIGRYDDELISRYGKAAEFHGYVDDLYSALREYMYFVAPITEGTGVKTKLLDAVVAGLPIVATSKAVEGFPFKDGVHYLNANSGEQFREAILMLEENQELRESLAESAHRVVLENFSEEAVYRKWVSVLGDRR